jgi:hypothetical protein
MVISDLCHLEEVSEVSNLVEGGIGNLNSTQTNWSQLIQFASANATSYAIGGSAIAMASSSNIGQVAQSNS